jgi:hypothetical protein
MGSFSPIVIALGIISLVGFAGAIIALIRKSATFHGYSELTSDARLISRYIGGETFRDGEDLVIAGNLNRLPITVRFSYQESTPGLNIRAEVPSTFTLNVTPQGSGSMEGRVTIRTGDQQIDSRFTTRTDHPTQARMFLGLRNVHADLQRLCCSTKTFFSLSPGVLELSELVIPSPYAGHHVIEHLKQIGQLAVALGHMPGAEAVKIQSIRRERNVLARVAMVVGIVFAIATVVTAMRARSAHPEALAVEPKPVGITPADASLIPGVNFWRLASSSDFDPAGVTWLGNHSVQANGRMEGNFSGTGEGRDVAYVLRREDGFRVVMLTNGQNRYDVTYPAVAIAARIPKGSLGNVEWSGTPPEAPDGDGLLLVLEAGNPASAVVVFIKGDRITSAAPLNYQNISF